MKFNKEPFVINGIEWNIAKAPSGSEALINQTDSRYCSLASTYNQTCTIYLDERMPKDQFKRVLMHELTHAFIDSMGFQTDDNDYPMNLEQVANFVAAHSEKIVKMANRYMEREYNRW